MTDQWTAPEVSRTEPTGSLGERDSLEQWLDFHRGTLLSKCTGLTAEQLVERPVPPSPLSLLGLVRHMTDVERWWFRMNAAGEDIDSNYWTDDAEDADWLDLDPTLAEEQLRRLEEETELCRRAATGRDLDGIVPGYPRHQIPERNLRWIYTHMIEEYARHNGHADLIREQVDGVTGE